MKTRVQEKRRLALLGSMALLALPFARVRAGDMNDMHDMPGMQGMPGMHDHHHHHMMNGVTRRTVSYQIPDVRMVREDGTAVSLPAELNDGKPVFLTFIYTTCTTICPIVSQTFSQLQGELGSDEARVHLASISIDPEQDTPARLREYAKRFGAGPEWHHYTGTMASSIAAQRAFDVYHGDKMSHDPVALIRIAPGQPWHRFDGFATAKDLLAEFRGLQAG
jgi:protein SCO1/2